jgi:hypothetical protein
MTKVPGDRLVLATISVLRTLVDQLASTGAMDQDVFIERLHQIAASHREAGDPNNLANAIGLISEHFETSSSGHT